MLTGPILAMLLAHGLEQLTYHGHMTGWTRLRQAAGPTVVLRRSVVHCHPRQCRALVLSVDPFSGGSGALVSPTGTVRCEVSITVTDHLPDHYCVSVSGCSLDGSACTAPR